MSLCLIAIFKNESHIIDEFITHYKNQGVDHFFLIDNGSDDNYIDKIKNFDNITLNIDSTKHCQEKHYNNYYLEKCKQFDWVIVCDFDEFIYARLKFKNIKEYLNTLSDDISQVSIPWKMFGSSGFKEQPSSVIKNFTKRLNYDKTSNFSGVIIENTYKYSLTKCIVRTKYLTRFVNHKHYTTNSNWIGPDNNQLIHKSKEFYQINENILSNSFLHLNHYPIQSYDWFMRVKATRGDVNSSYYENHRGEKYFKEYDNSSSDINDFELANI